MTLNKFSINGKPVNVDFKKLFFPILLFIVVIIVLLKFSELREIGKILAQTKWYWILAALISQYINFTLQTGVYYSSFKILKLPFIKFSKLFKIAFTIMFLNLTVPSLGFAGNVWFLKKLKKCGIKEGKGHGEGKLFNRDGTLKYEGEIKEGKSHGEGKAYYENGILNYVGDWEDARYHGKGNLYTKNGSLVYVGSIKKGQRNGKGKEYHEDGTLIKGEFKDDTVDGKAEWYNKNGVLRYRGDWKKGKMHGYGETYDENGRYVGKFKWKDGDIVD